MSFRNGTCALSHGSSDLFMCMSKAGVMCVPRVPNSTQCSTMEWFSLVRFLLATLKMQSATANAEQATMMI